VWKNIVSIKRPLKVLNIDFLRKVSCRQYYLGIAHIVSDQWADTDGRNVNRYGKIKFMETIVSVIGGNSPSPAEYKFAESLGQALARSGYTIVCGGREGIMEAVCKGAKSANGKTIGILPSDSRSEANDYIDIPIVTGLGFARNSIVVQTGQVVIAIGGQFGTLNELSFAMIKSKSIIGINTWGATSPNSDFPVIRVSTVEEAIKEVARCLPSPQ